MLDRRISLVVPSYNRARYLDVLLTSLTWSAVAPDAFEVIVVNDGGTDDLPAVVDRGRRRGLDVRLVTLRTGGAPRNNARARNAGLATARYPIVVQTDPDIVFLDDVLAAVREDVDGWSLCSCDGYFPLTQAATEALVFAPGATPGAATLRQAAQGRPNQAYSPDGVGGLHGAFACATQVLRDLGGYDESFEYWGWEDRELLVTAAARGLKRRRMRRTAVVHLWHPVQRGDLGREALAAVGKVSRAAWDVQMQRAAAEWPRWERTRPIPRPPAGEGEAPVSYDAAALDCWRTPGDDEAFAMARARLDEGHRDDARAVFPRSYQMYFDALRGEADVLAAAGHVALARDLVCEALRRPWEPRLLAAAPAGDGAADTAEASAAAADEDTDGDCAHVAPSSLWLYQHVDEALERLAAFEHALGRPQRRDRVLDALDDCDGGPARGAAMRLGLALEAGDRRTAMRTLSALDEHPRAAGQEALALECLLLDGRHGEARARLGQVLATAAAGDYFDQLRGMAYARLLAPELAARADHAAAADTSEFLFSVGVRSERAGLLVAAWLLYRAFLEGGAPAEPRVLAECEARSLAVQARLGERAAAGVVARVCAPVMAAVSQPR